MFDVSAGGALICVCLDESALLSPPQAESKAAVLSTSAAPNWDGLKNVIVMVLVVNTEQAL